MVESDARGGRVHSAYSPSSGEVNTGTQDRNPEAEPKAEATEDPSFLACFLKSPRTTCLRNGSTHSGLGPRTSIIHGSAHSGLGPRTSIIHYETALQTYRLTDESEGSLFQLKFLGPGLSLDDRSTKQCTPLPLPAGSQNQLFFCCCDNIIAKSNSGRKGLFESTLLYHSSSRMEIGAGAAAEAVEE